MTSPHLLSDSDLVAGFKDLLIEERGGLVAQLDFLLELDRRKLTFEHSSLWSYLVHECGMEEWTAERKIRAARLLKRFPEVRGKLESGRLNLSLLDLASHCGSKEKLSDTEIREVLDLVSGLSCRKARRELAARFPESAEAYPDRIRPISGECSEVRFIAPQELLEKLDEIKALLAHAYPKITMAELLDLLAREYLKKHSPMEKARRAEERRMARDETASRSREKEVPTVPAEHGDLQNGKPNEPICSPTTKQATRKNTATHRDTTQSLNRRAPGNALIRELIRRDGRKCSYVDPKTRRPCASTYALEIDHVTSWSKGGGTTLPNLRSYAATTINAFPTLNLEAARSFLKAECSNEPGHPQRCWKSTPRKNFSPVAERSLDAKQVRATKATRRRSKHGPCASLEKTGKLFSTNVTPSQKSEPYHRTP